VRISEDAARQRPDRLLETFALRVARQLGERWPAAERVRVGVTKANVPVQPAPDEATVEVTLGAAR
jgi:dihydroneopterin aldolase